MPLYRFSAQQAIANREDHATSRWGGRATDNRVEPIARPRFAVPFRIAPGTRIFTVGSCFARNVEDELIRRGFDLPMLAPFKTEEKRAVLNNYGTPSIYNEFAWAFGEREFDEQDHILEVQPGSFVDLHVPPGIPAAPKERVIARRRNIMAAYRTAATCPVMIMTLGLVETWFDTRTGYYLNGTPRPSRLTMEPERFELHVLSFDEAYDYLERTIRILRRHGHADLRILLTVSPVPLSRTHRDEDIMVANTYSKSVLRSAAETLVARHDFVTYYPSYESVTLSDRKRAWRDDLVHVTHELVALNVGRMVDAFIGGGESEDEVRRAIQNGGEAVAVEKARAARAGSWEKAAVFFAEFGALSRQSAEFALEHAGFLFDRNDHAGVLALLSAPPLDMPEMRAALLHARTLAAMGRPREAMDLLDPLGAKTDGPARKRLRVPDFWHAYLDVAKATGEEALVLGVMEKFLIALPPHAHNAHAAVGRWFQEQGKLDRAIAFFELSVADSEPGNAAHLYLAECLAAQGKTALARAALARLDPRGPGMRFHYDRMMMRLGASSP